MATTVAAPFAHTSDATEVRTTSARLNGFATPNGSESAAWFEWGERGTFSQTNAPVNVGHSFNVVRVSAGISNLVTGLTYQYRLVVSNAVGLRRGTTRLLTTGNRLTAWGYNYLGQNAAPVSSNGWVAIAAGGDHSLALRPDGRVVAWGDNYVGQTNVPASLSNAVAVACGGGQSRALKADGTVAEWGYNDPSQTNGPAGLSNVVALSAGRLALRADGTLATWGGIDNGQTAWPPGEINLVELAVGYSHSVALRNDGTVVAWGDSVAGQTNVPSDLTNVIAVSAGNYYSLALRADGTVVGWGTNGEGQKNVPAGLTNVLAISAGSAHCLALRADGSVVAWGYNSSGQADVPSGLSNVVAIAAGSQYSVALGGNAPPHAQNQNVTGLPNADSIIPLTGTDPNGDALSYIISGLPAAGSLYQYQSGGRGSIITNTGARVLDPGGRIIFAPANDTVGEPYASVRFLVNDRTVNSAPATVTVSIVAPLAAFTLPATPISPGHAQLNGFVGLQGLSAKAWFEWGTNTLYGQTSGTTIVSAESRVVHVNQPIAGLADGQVIHCRLVASNASVVVRGADQQFVSGGKVFGWGDNSSGQSAPPTNLGATVSLAGGLSHSLALRMDGTVTAWGNNVHGQTDVPAGLVGVMAVVGGGFHNLALRTDGSVVAWGRNHLGQTDVPASATNIVTIAAGGQHSIALRADGSLVAWGDNSQGQRNASASLSNVVGIAAGWYHNVALRSDGTVAAWGANAYGQSAVPADLTNVVWVGAGLYHSLGLRSDGAIVAWGLDSSGQTDIPANATNTSAVAGGGAHNLALQTHGTLSGWGYNFFGQATPPANLSNVVNLAAGGSHSLALRSNHLPVAFDQVVAGYPNTDLLVTLTGSDVDNDSLSYRVKSLPAVGSLFQFIGGSRGAQIVAPDTTLVDALGRILFTPAADQVASPHATFGFTTSDGFADSAPRTVTINILLPSAPILDSASSGVTTNGEFELAFTGATNARYRVWASTNLLNWELLGTAPSWSPGRFLFLDASSTNRPQRFYRATAP